LSALILAALLATPPVVSPTQEVILGKEALAAYVAEHPETDDGELAARVDAIGRRLSVHTDRPDTLHRAVVVEGTELQAVAFLGGAVAVMEALGRAFDDDELAFALGHEMAHVDLRHQVDRPVVEDVVREAAGSSAARVETALSMEDRHAELEADRFGALYAVRAGFSFSAALRALRKLQEGGGPEVDFKHPEYGDRIQALTRFETELRRALEAFDRGGYSLAQGRASEAVDYLVLFVASFPESVAGRVNLGAAYLARWRANRTEGDRLAESLPILPDPGVRVRGSFHELDGRNARSHFETALRLDPSSTVARLGIAMVLFGEGLADDARAYVTPALDDPRLAADALLFLGNVDYRQGAWRSAVDRYQAALRARPEWPAARANLARALEKEGRLEEATQEWNRLLNDPVFGEEARRHLTRS
jgi:predicted Zn-dependent protease